MQHRKRAHDHAIPTAHFDFNEGTRSKLLRTSTWLSPPCIYAVATAAPKQALYHYRKRTRHANIIRMLTANNTDAFSTLLQVANEERSIGVVVVSSNSSNAATGTFT